MAEELIKLAGFVGSCSLPLFNIPLILHIVKRRSSDDLSLTWVFGVWGCIILMTPATLISEDLVFKCFGILNILFFSAVVFFTLKFRTPKSTKKGIV